MTNKLKKKFLDYLQSKSAFYIYIKTYRDRHLSIFSQSANIIVFSINTKL